MLVIISYFNQCEGDTSQRKLPYGICTLNAPCLGWLVLQQSSFPKACRKGPSMVDTLARRRRRDLEAFLHTYPHR